MDVNPCTYRVSGKARALLALYCSKTIKDHMFEDLVPAKIRGISSTYCNVVEDDVEILWENMKEKLAHNFAVEYEFLNDEPENMTFRVFDVELAFSFEASGQEVDSESFLDNLYISVDFQESIYESMYRDEHFAVDVLESIIQPFDFHLTVL